MSEHPSLYQFFRGTITNSGGGPTHVATEVLLVLDKHHFRPATGPEEAMYELLTRLQAWDVLNLPAGHGDDGPYWQGEIAKVIGERRA